MGFFKESHPGLVLLSAYSWSFLFGYMSEFYGAEFLYGFMVGFSAYTLTEYFIHRCLFHIISKLLPIPERLYYKVHGRHHRFPTECNRVALPIAHQWVLVVILTVLWRGFLLCFSWGSWKLTYLLGSGMCMIS